MGEDVSARLALPMLAAGQAQKEMTHNEALQRLDMLVQPVAASADGTAPPAGPEPGQCWIVGDAPVGEWTGHGRSIAQWTAGGWRFATPAAGWRVHVVDRGAAMVHDGTAWRDDAVRSGGLVIGGARVVGPRRPAIAGAQGGSTVDTQARTAIASILETLRGHGLIAS